MSEETTQRDGDGHADDTRQLLLAAGAVALALVLLALTVSMVLIFSLRGDVAVLEEQARKSAKATKAMGEELAGLKADLGAAAPRAGAARPSNIDAADPASDCVIRPGAKNSLADCIKLSPQD